jgi:hypothetical protein
LQVKIAKAEEGFLIGSKVFWLKAKFKIHPAKALVGLTSFEKGGG